MRREPEFDEHAAEIPDSMSYRAIRPLVSAIRSFFSRLAAALIAFVVQSGELGSADTMHRLQSTHSFWTSEPPVFPNEYPEFGVHGRNGSLQSWYGIGQSLLMLPPDILGTCIEKLHIFDRYGDTDPTVRDIVVTYLTQIFVTVLTALVCFKLLRQFAFSVNQSIAGVLAFLLATTHLHYTQNMMENNYICLLTLTGFAFEYEWLQNGKPARAADRHRRLRVESADADHDRHGSAGRRALRFAGAVVRRQARARAVGAMPGIRGDCDSGLLLLRLPRSAVPVLSIWIVHQHLCRPGREGDHRARPEPARATGPGRRRGMRDFSERCSRRRSRSSSSIRCIILALVLLVLHWRRLAPAVRAYAIATCLMLLAYLSFYARYFAWAGDFAWGDRYVSTAVELVALLAIPLLLKYRREAGRVSLGDWHGAAVREPADPD